MEHVLALDILVLMLGFVVGYLYYIKFRTAVGGVIATPFLVIYVVKEPAIILSTGLAISLAVVALEIVHDRYLIYGRRAFYVAAFISMIVFLSTYNWIGTQISTAFTSLIGGIIAYNMHKEIVSNGDYLKPVLVWMAEFLTVIIIALIIYILAGVIAI